MTTFTQGGFTAQRERLVLALPHKRRTKAFHHLRLMKQADIDRMTSVCRLINTGQ